MYGDSWDKLYDTVFWFKQGKYNSFRCCNIITFDIETSNGWRQPNGKVIGFSHEHYNLKYDNDGNLIAGCPKYHDMIENGEPVSCLYIWQIAVESMDGNIYVFIGRTWESLDNFMTMLATEIRRQSIYGKDCVNRDLENNFVMKSKHNVYSELYIHNLGFEYQHLRNIYDKKFAGKGRGKKSGGNVFARQSRKPMKASINISKVKFEYRDSLVLVNKSLSNWCKDEHLAVQKLEEPKDYYLEIRTPKTPLKDEEINYSINDVVSMVHGIRKYRDKYETLSNIPLTQTGEVRRTCRAKIAKHNPSWAKQCYDVTISYTPSEFKRLAWLFQGGWTHANKCYVGYNIKDVKCFDFASSYPAVMCTRTFPLGKFITCDPSEFSDLEAQDLNNPKFRWYMKVKVKNVKSKLQNSYWSLSKVAVDEDRPIQNQVVDNGRIYCCDYMITYMTDLDWDTFKQCYYYDTVEVLEIYKSLSGYFPSEMIETILDYFQYKTSLKGQANSESLYCESKQFINSIYGVFVTKIISSIISFDEEGWHSTEPDDETFYDMLHQTSEEESFTMYQAGVWVTSWARHNLFDFIIPLDKRICYCDTDSIKGVFTEDDIKFIEEYNNSIASLEDKVATLLGIDPSKFTALTSKGKIKRLGVMEREADCQEFKTLGAKRYVDLVDGEIECTIAGLPKRAAKAKITSVDMFDNNLFWDTSESEKLMAHYEDHQKPCVWTDRDGVEYFSEAQYGICLQPTTFDLSMSDDFIKFLNTLKYGFSRDDEFFTDTPAWFYNK